MQWTALSKILKVYSTPHVTVHTLEYLIFLTVNFCSSKTTCLECTTPLASTRWTLFRPFMVPNYTRSWAWSAKYELRDSLCVFIEAVHPNICILALVGTLPNRDSLRVMLLISLDIVLLWSVAAWLNAFPQCFHIVLVSLNNSLTISISLPFIRSMNPFDCAL